MAKFIKPLTDTQIRKLKHTEKPYTVGDGNNLYIFVSQHSKIWQFIYTQPTTKKRAKKNIGKYPAMSLAKAREKAVSYLESLENGVDPFVYEAEKAEQERINAITVREMAEIWAEKKKIEVLPATFKDLWQRLELWLFPAFGDVQLKDVHLNKL